VQLQSPNKSVLSISTKNSDSPIQLIAYKKKLHKISIDLQKLEDDKHFYERKIKEMGSHSTPIRIKGREPSPINSHMESMKVDLEKRMELNSKKSSLFSEPDRVELEINKLRETVNKLSKTNEEYKNYIIILKDAIKTKIENMHLTDKFDTYCGKKRDRIDTFAEFIMLQNKIEEYNRLVKDGKGKEIHYESINTLNKSDYNEITELTAKLKEALAELKNCQEVILSEKRKVEEQKKLSSMLETQNIQKEHKLKECEQGMKKQEEALKSVQINYNKVKNELKSTQNELQKQLDFINQKEHDSKEVHIQLLNRQIAESNKKYEETLKTLMGKLELSAAEISKLKADCSTKDNLLKELQQAVKLYKASQKVDNHDFYSSVSQVSPAFKHLQQSTNNYQSENIKLYQENTNIRNQNLALKNSILSLNEKNDTLCEEIKQCKLVLKSVETLKFNEAELERVFSLS
jgi:chromosome segregation ATPase